jgi:hypothetical protein
MECNEAGDHLPGVADPTTQAPPNRTPLRAGPIRTASVSESELCVHFAALTLLEKAARPTSAQELTQAWTTSRKTGVTVCKSNRRVASSRRRCSSLMASGWIELTTR